MMKSSAFLFRLALVFLTPWLIAAPLFAKSTVGEKRAEIQKMRDTVLANLYQLHPGAKERSNRPSATPFSQMSAST